MIFQEFKLERRKINLEPLTLPEDMALMDALDRVLRLPSVEGGVCAYFMADRWKG
jgi:hypothetical protein